MNNFEITPYNDDYKDQLLRVWENSVLATHHFLEHSDFTEIRAMLRSFDFNALQVFCLVDEEKTLAGFIGISDGKIEMLFVDPAYFGQGLGWRLLNVALKECNAHQVDVNEQNRKALEFYLKCGFEVFERSEKDDEGRDYPVLRMRIRNSPL